jgi:signal transduction histidine kinase
MASSRQNLPAARLELLLQASELLGGSLDTAATLANLAVLLVPRLADGYAVDLVDAAGDLHRIAAVHRDSSKEPLCRALMSLGEPDPNAPDGVLRLLAAGKPRLFERVTDEALRAGARDATHLEILRSLEIQSMMIVPLKARGRSVGLLWLFYASRSKRTYRPADLAYVEEIAARAALAIENARLWREAQDAIAAREEFLAIASHELRTPLTSMLLGVQGELRRLAKHPEHAPTREEAETFLTSFMHQTTRLAHLVEELLDVSTLSSGTLTMVCEEVDLGRVVRAAAEALGREARRSGCTLDVVVEEGVVGWWDPARIAQVVTALVSNAIKYGKGQPVAVGVKRNGDRGEIVVEDHGIGIERGLAARIFERYERQVSTRNYGGFGLGLWIARQLVEANGGTIHVQSEPGSGATFRVELPLSNTRVAGETSKTRDTAVDAR